MRTDHSDDEARHVAARSEALSQYQSELSNRDRRLGETSKQHGPGSANWQDCERQFKIAYEDCQSKALALSRATDAKRISPVAMGVLFAGLCLFETPVNKFMFDILLALQNWESYVISFAMSFGLLLIAHVAGFSTRQIKGDFEDKFYLGKIALVLALFAFLLAAVAILTVCRAYASTVAAGSVNYDIFAQVIAQVKYLGPWAALGKALEDQSAVMLAAFNLTGILCAYILSFITHDSDVVYQAAIDAQKHAQKKYSRMAGKYERIVSRIERKFSPKLNRYAKAFSTHNGKVVAFKQLRGDGMNDLDLLDISGLDKTLADARRGIGDRVRYLSGEPPAANPTSTVSQAVPINIRHRRA